MGVDRIVCVVGDCDDAVASLAPRAVVYDTAPDRWRAFLEAQRRMSATAGKQHFPRKSEPVTKLLERQDSIETRSIDSLVELSDFDTTVFDSSERVTADVHGD